MHKQKNDEKGVILLIYYYTIISLTFFSSCLTVGIYEGQCGLLIYVTGLLRLRTEMAAREVTLPQDNTCLLQLNILRLNLVVIYALIILFP